MEILAIDIGGTKSATALCSVSQGKVTHLTSEHTWKSREHPTFDDIARAWSQLHPGRKIDAVGIGVAGPVSGSFPTQRCQLTNLPWRLDASKLSLEFGHVPVFICNDMESHGWGILGLSNNDVFTLNQGHASQVGCKALIAAGTGLGEAITAWDGQRHIPLGGEGGHSAFSPCDEREDRLLVFLRKRIGGHVSWERVLGGRDGFANLCMFVAQDRNQKIPESLVHLTQNVDDWGAGVIQLAGQGDQFCKDVLAFYAHLYGREAANLAMKCMPYSGVYLGGGIAPRIQEYLQKHFMEGFTDKGRFSGLLAQIPVQIILDSKNGLKGAALGAWHQLKCTKHT